MSDIPTLSDEKISESACCCKETTSKKPLTWWKKMALIIIGIATVFLLIYSSINFKQEVSFSPLIPFPPPTYTGEEPLLIDTVQEAYNSNNNLVLVIIPCSDSALNNSITAVVMEAASEIRSKHKIYVGVFILPQDDTLSYPKLRLRLYTEAAKNLIQTMQNDITKDSIYISYLERKNVRQ